MPEAATLPPADVSASEAAARPSKRARWRRWTLAAAATLLAVLAGVWFATPGVLLRLAPVSLQFEDGAPAAVVDRFGGPNGTYVVGYEHDAYLDVDVRLHNRGPVGIAVDDVRLDLQAAPLLVPADADVPGPMSAGERAAAGVQLRFDNCEAYHEREAMLVEAVEVEARVLGRTVIERVPLDRPLMARSPMLWQCPDRTLDRSDDLRSQGAVSRDAP